MRKRAPHHKYNKKLKSVFFCPHTNTHLTGGTLSVVLCQFISVSLKLSEGVRTDKNDQLNGWCT